MALSRDPRILWLRDVLGLYVRFGTDAFDACVNSQGAENRCGGAPLHSPRGEVVSWRRAARRACTCRAHVTLISLCGVNVTVGPARWRGWLLLFVVSARRLCVHV